MTEPPRRRTVPPSAVAALVALAAGLAVASREMGGLGGDDAEYVLLAKSLGGFEGYSSGWAPGPRVPHALYPPLFPLLLAPFAGSAPGSFLPCHLLVALLGAGATGLVALLFERRGLPPWAAAAGALVPALSFFWLASAADVLSELPFLFFVASALLLLEPGDADRLPTRRVGLAAAAAGLAFGTRTSGLALVLVVAAALVLDRRTRGRAAWIAAGCLLAACAAWFLYARACGTGGGYIAQLAGGEGGLAGAPGRAFRTLAGTYLPKSPRFVFPHPGEGWLLAGLALWGLVLVATVEGFLRRRALAVPEAFLVVYLAMQSAWPFDDPRFALPFAILLVPLALETVQRIAARLASPPTTGRISVAAALLLLLPNGSLVLGQVLPRALRERPEGVPGDHEPARFAQTWTWSDDQYRQAAPSLAAFLHACDLVREGVPGARGLPGGPVLASNPRAAALLCGRTSVQPPAGAPPDAVAALVREKGVALVLVDNFAGGYSEALCGYASARAADLEPLVVLPGQVSILGVRR